MCCRDCSPIKIVTAVWWRSPLISHSTSSSPCYWERSYRKYQCRCQPSYGLLTSWQASVRLINLLLIWWCAQTVLHKGLCHLHPCQPCTPQVQHNLGSSNLEKYSMKEYRALVDEKRMRRLCFLRKLGCFIVSTKCWWFFITYLWRVQHTLL